MMSRRSVQCLAAGGVLAVSFVVTGCSKDKPAICSDVDALKSSVADVTSVSLDKSSLAALPGDVARVQSDLVAQFNAVNNLSRAIEGYSGLPTADQRRQLDSAFDDATRAVDALNRVLQTDTAPSRLTVPTKLTKDQ